MVKVLKKKILINGFVLELSLTNMEMKYLSMIFGH